MIALISIEVENSGISGEYLTNFHFVSDISC